MYDGDFGEDDEELPMIRTKFNVDHENEQMDNDNDSSIQPMKQSPAKKLFSAISNENKTKLEEMK